MRTRTNLGPYGMISAMPISDTGNAQSDLISRTANLIGSVYDAAALMTSIEVAPREPPHFGRALQEAALEIAISEIGNGENPALGNNRGDHIDRYRTATGEPGGAGAWCAAACSYWFSVAAACFVGSDLKARRLRVPFPLSRGAKRLVRNMGTAGRFVDLPEPGCLIGWHNRNLGPRHWRGHVEIVCSYREDHDELLTISANANNRQLESGRRYSIVDRRTWSRGSWRVGLYRIASLA